jgi:hypothetical protein
MLRSPLRLSLVVTLLTFSAEPPSVLAQPAADAAAPSPDHLAIQQDAVNFVEAYARRTKFVLAPIHLAPDSA